MWFDKHKIHSKQSLIFMVTSIITVELICKICRDKQLLYTVLAVQLNNASLVICTI